MRRKCIDNTGQAELGLPEVIGRMIAERQKKQGWGAAVIPRLARDIRNEMPEVKGFSERNIDRMIAFHREYPNLEREFSPLPVAKSVASSTKTQIGPPLVAQLRASRLPGAISPTPLAKLSASEDASGEGQRLVAQLPWAHNVLLMQKMNFYCSVVDDRLRHEADQPTIGLILCQDRKKVVAEYALRGVRKPIGISEYQLTRALPSEFKSALPTIEEIEKELSGREGDHGKKRK